MVAPDCLRCDDVQLTRLSESTDDIGFLECPLCGRQYAKKPGEAVTYRWLHPVSLPLYSVLFDQDPLSRAADIAQLFIEQRPADDLLAMLKEIELELDHPTQQVRAILDNPQSEEVCREFLGGFVARVRSELQ